MGIGQQAHQIRLEVHVRLDILFAREGNLETQESREGQGPSQIFRWATMKKHHHQRQSYYWRKVIALLLRECHVNRAYL